MKMKRLLIAVVFVVFIAASGLQCLAQTNVTSVCLHGWNTTSGTNGHPVTMSWTYGTAGASGIGIQRSTSANGPWSLVGVVGPMVTNYTDQTVMCAMSYWYRIYAFNSAGDSGYSNTAGPATEGSCP
jgi:hypothetical protein